MFKHNLLGIPVNCQETANFLLSCCKLKNRLNNYNNNSNFFNRLRKALCRQECACSRECGTHLKLKRMSWTSKVILETSVTLLRGGSSMLRTTNMQKT